MTKSETSDLTQRWPSALPFVAIGSIAIISAGLAAALTASMPSYLASWAVAFLVLVAGAAQIALGLGQALLTSEVPSGRLVTAELMLFNLGNAAVLLGSLLNISLLTLIGSASMLIALAVLFWTTRSSTRGIWLRYAYWILIAVLFVSVFIGVVIARGRIT